MYIYIYIYMFPTPGAERWAAPGRLRSPTAAERLTVAHPIKHATIM